MTYWLGEDGKAVCSLGDGCFGYYYEGQCQPQATVGTRGACVTADGQSGQLNPSGYCCVGSANQAAGGAEDGGSGTSPWLIVGVGALVGVGIGLIAMGSSKKR